MLAIREKLFATPHDLSSAQNGQGPDAIQQPPRKQDDQNALVRANEMPTLSVKQSRAPSEEIFRHFSKHISGLENQTLLKLQLEILGDQVREDIKNVHPNRGLGLTISTVSLIFLICESLKLTDGIKFATLEIYDRFMEKYNDILVRELRKRNDKNKIESTTERIKQYALLRIVSCIQLASKVYADHSMRYISSLEVQKILHTFDIEFKLDRINASELRVVKTLDNKLKYVNSFDVMECILTGLELEATYARQVYELSVVALEYVCKQHEEVYSVFRRNWKENCGREERKLFRTIEFNKGIEAAGILAGVICVSRKKDEDEKRLLKAIARISETDMEVFMILATIVVGVMIGAVTPPPVPKKLRKAQDQNQAAIPIS